MEFQRAAILGVGLIGASLAAALKGKSLSSHVAGYGRSEENLGRAREKGIIDSYELDAARACEGADLVVFATPVETFVPLAEKVKGVLRKGTLVIDVGSVKGGLVYEMEKLMPDGVKFVGCHPIAGSERSGVDASNAELFEGALCIVTKTADTDESTGERVAFLWESIGCRVEYLSPEKHDRIYGLVSHFPHLAIYAMVNAAGEANHDCLKFAGPGFMDTTRIALSPSALWRSICLMNRKNLIDYIELFRNHLDTLSLYLREEDAEALHESFERARSLRERIGH